MSGFNVEKMFVLAKNAIEKFAKEHGKETFYAFSIDAAMLCLNSIERFDQTLKYYQEKYSEKYYTQEVIEELKYNTGDWAYQGFFELNEGFDQELYSEHYNIPFETKNLSGNELEILLQNTPYHHAMASLLEKLLDSKVFDLLNKATDFKAFLSEHNY